MWEGEAVVSLGTVLSRLPNVELEWRLVELDAVAKPDSGLDLRDLERRIDEVQPLGLALSWRDLKNLADQVDHVIECLLVGVAKSEDSPYRIRVIVEALDSTEWQIFGVPA